MKMTNSNRVFNTTEADVLRLQTKLAEVKLEHSLAKNAAWLAIPSGLFAAGYNVATQAAIIYVLAGYVGYWLAGPISLLAWLAQPHAARHIKAAAERSKAASAALKSVNAEVEAMHADLVRGS